MIDGDDQIGAVHRQVSASGRETRTVTLTQTYASDVDDVWDACTNAERIPRWFLPVTGDLRLGGRYQLEGNAGGTVEECEPPTRFRATWEFGGGMSWIEVRLDRRGRRPHPARARAHRAGRRPLGGVRSRARSGSVGTSGWSGCPCTSRPASRSIPLAVDEWTRSDAGLRFMTRAATAWRDADVASGTPSRRRDRRGRADHRRVHRR